MTEFLSFSALYLARISPLFMAPSLVPIGKMPPLIKLVLSLGIALLLSLSHYQIGILGEISSLDLVVAIAQELVIGIGLVLGIQTTFAAILFAGKVVDLQLGFGVAAILDPMTRTNESLVGSLLNVLFTVAFFTLDIHHLLLEGIAATFSAFPVGTGLLLPNLSQLIAFISGQFVLGLLVVMPTMLGIFMLDILVGFASRSMPQVNVYFVSLPLKIFIGLLILSISLKYMSVSIANILSQSVFSWFDSLNRVVN